MLQNINAKKGIVTKLTVAILRKIKNWFKTLVSNM